MLAGWGIPALLVTHDREEALALADSIQVIDEGKPVSRGAPLEILGQPGLGRVARLVGVENLFHMRVESRNHRDGTMVCVGGGLHIEVPVDRPPAFSGQEPLDRDAAEDDRVAVAVRSSDIILASQEIVGSTARNQLPGVVTKVELHPPGYEITLDCGQPIRCQITGGALKEMEIRPGLRLWAVFKASSCFLVQDLEPEPGGPPSP